MQYILYRCNICKKHFILLSDEVTYSEKESKYITCPYFGKHKDISVVGSDDSLKECIKSIARKDTYVKKNRRTVQKKWS